MLIKKASLQTLKVNPQLYDISNPVADLPDQKLQWSLEHGQKKLSRPAYLKRLEVCCSDYRHSSSRRTQVEGGISGLGKPSSKKISAIAISYTFFSDQTTRVWKQSVEMTAYINWIFGYRWPNGRSSKAYSFIIDLHLLMNWDEVWNLNAGIRRCKRALRSRESYPNWQTWNYPISRWRLVSDERKKKE